MTRAELIELVENTFGDYGIKTVSATDINKSAYVPNIAQKRIFESFNINPIDRRDDIVIKELFTGRELTMSYYATLRVGADRSPEPRMGLMDLISYLSVGDEILFTKDNENIFIYNLSNLIDDDTVNEENLYTQIDIGLLRERATNINARPTRVEQTISVFPRNSVLKAYVKVRSNYSCEMPGCDYTGFSKTDGSQYIEVHHVIPLSEGGEDNVNNTVALCPNCHRKLHYAGNKEELRQILLDYLRNL